MKAKQNDQEPQDAAAATRRQQAGTTQPTTAGVTKMAQILGMKIQGLNHHVGEGTLVEGRDFDKNEKGHRVFKVAQVIKTLRENTTPLKEHEKNRPGQQGRKPAPQGDDPLEWEDDGSPATEGDAGGGLTLNDLKRRNLYLKNQKEQLELDVIAGKLVERSAVESALYEFGADIRQNLTAIPNKVIDNMLACDTREEAIGLLEEAIDEALIALVKIGELKFSEHGK